jgi:hypothetical protein
MNQESLETVDWNINIFKLIKMKKEVLNFKNTKQVLIGDNVFDVTKVNGVIINHQYHMVSSALSSLHRLLNFCQSISNNSILLSAIRVTDCLG